MMAAFSTALTVSVILSCLLFVHHLTEANDAAAAAAAPTPYALPQTIDCGSACEGRCKLSSRPNLCKRACGSCCAKCNCVPPGTSGNLNSCPCYANLTTHNQMRKCP